MFCEHCQISHDEVKVTRGHCMKRLEDMVSIESWGEDPLYCQKHTDQKLEMFDKTCSQLLCFRCVYEDHIRHEVVGIKDYTVSAKEKVQGHLTSIIQQRLCIEEGKNTLVQQGERLRERAGILRESVRQTFEELRTLVDQRQKEVLLALDQSVDTVEQQRKKSDQTLQLMSTEYKTKEEYLQASIGYLTSTDMVLNAETILKATACNNTDLRIPSDDRRDASIVFNRGDIDDIKSSIRCFGSVLSLRDQNNKEQVTVNIGSDSKAYRGNMEQSEAGGLQVVAIARSDKELWSQLTSDYTSVKMDKERVNIVSMISDNELINVESGSKEKISKALNKYKGTTSTRPLPGTGFSYWEMYVDTNIKIKFSCGFLAFEVGIANMNTVTNNLYIRDSNQTNVMTAQMCSDHKTMCINIWKDGKLKACGKTTGENIVGGRIVAKIGVLYDKRTNKISYFNLLTSTVIQSVPLSNVDEQVWTTFGVYNKSYCDVTLKVLSGKDLQFTQVKNDLISKALSNLN